ncbi:MAG: von Willebrand factor type A domain-containing protein, partial [bacterium]|nr:von Willebrand factor type A domain-containing protein [Candidatus Kapabacteria bacterium]
FVQEAGTLTGRVIDDEGKPLIGARIILQGTTFGGLSKAPDGKFIILGIRAGDYKAEIAGIGQQPEVRDVRISEGLTTDIGTITLRSAAVSTKSITVTADSPTDRDIGRESIERSSRTNIIDAVGTAGGAAKGESNGVSLRGGRTSEKAVRVDGVEVTDPYAGGYGGTAALYPTVSPVTVNEERSKVKQPAHITNAVVTTLTSVEVHWPTIQPDPTSTEDYSKIYENQFLASHISPLSTFSIDVDRASYSNVRRILNSGYRPPADAVRIEELVNYFDYGYAEPDDEQPFGINTEMSDCPWDRSHRLVRIGLQGERMRGEALPPSNLTFLIDVSGSMSPPERLPLLKQGFKLLINQLRPEDNVAIVVYAGAAGLVLPMTSGRNRADIEAALDRLQSGGSTAGAAGIELAYKIARDNFVKGGNNRVILATDGDFNVGVSSQTELVSMIEERRKDGVFLTVLGFGTGNYQDAKMEQLADKGNGNYAYIDNINEAKKVFVNELGSTIFTIAKDVKIQVVFSPERVESYRLIGYENRMLATEDFDDVLKDAGELGAGHSVTAIYEIVPRGATSANLDGWLGRKDTLDLPEDWKEGEMMRVRLRYKLPDSDVSSLIEGPVIDRGVRIERASDDFRFAAAVAEFGMLLRDSRHKGNATYDDVLRLANGAKGLDSYGYRTEFISLVEKARALSPTTASR